MRSTLMMAAGAVLTAAVIASAPSTAPAQEHAGSGVPLKEQLAAARRASAKYQDVKVAVADGYEDIHIDVPRMGKHYLKAALVDTIFDPSKPEILVYVQGKDQKLELAAVEYAQPLSETAPDGFTGSDDKWFADTQNKLWTLHAWVWLENPAGMFEAFNPRAP